MEKFVLFISDNSLAVFIINSLNVILNIYERKKGGRKIYDNELTR